MSNIASWEIQPGARHVWWHRRVLTVDGCNSRLAQVLIFLHGKIRMLLQMIFTLSPAMCSQFTHGPWLCLLAFFLKLLGRLFEARYLAQGSRERLGLPMEYERCQYVRNRIHQQISKNSHSLSNRQLFSTAMIMFFSYFSALSSID